MTLYDWPRAAAFGRVIPKTKIYEHAGANTGLKDLFVREVDQIVWSHKLAPETVNLAATKQVAEIQVFRITARTATLDRDVLRAIDKAIPFPLIFEVAHGGRVRLSGTTWTFSPRTRLAKIFPEPRSSSRTTSTTMRLPIPMSKEIS
ncbi:hypothetical protein C4N9_16625 [Pararhodobacter marinus]|uniref:DUF4391 domain-containing protein n=1 Tax=Pararhodobacter marinus TaxID=2184063 RepID=A0A2U2C782_9RHOB|nr:DUF4391 domain-containing protein [Pararhodobacter marinus]PWE27654.1 hypothetical protein C4N9_16625 [Pararhodobacter marinus]